MKNIEKYAKDIILYDPEIKGVESYGFCFDDIVRE